jgi:hypothetical protein
VLREGRAQRGDDRALGLDIGARDQIARAGLARDPLARDLAEVAQVDRARGARGRERDGARPLEIEDRRYGSRSTSSRTISSCIGFQQELFNPSTSG